MSNINRDIVSAEQELRLVGPGRAIVPLTAGLSYRRQDPYAIKLSFVVDVDQPVVWSVDRELLASALYVPKGIGDIRAWPSVPSARAGKGARTGEKILNIVLGPPGGCALFEASAAGIEAFLARTYELVPVGQESACLDLDAELTELLSQA